MRALVDLEDDQVRELDRIARERRQSRASLIRAAISGYLAGERSRKAGDAFGLWADRRIDGLDYQRKVRDEW